MSGRGWTHIDLVHIQVDALEHLLSDIGAEILANFIDI